MASMQKVESFSVEKFKREVRRKSLHLPIFVFPVLALYSRYAALLLLGVLTVFYIVVVMWEHSAPHAVTPFYRFIDHFKRSRPADPAPIYLGLGIFWCLLVAPPSHTFFAVTILAVCDSAAALFGMSFGRNKIGKLSKTWQGSSAFFIFAFVSGIFLMTPPAAFIAALVLTVVEIFATSGTDNLFLPIAAQLLLVGLR